MPLAAASDLAPILGVAENHLRKRLARLRRGGWLGSVRRGMTEPPQLRWFLTEQAVDALYATDHTHLGPRDLARGDVWRYVLAPPQAAGPPFAFDHEHLGHNADLSASPFLGAADEVRGHEHPPWTATARGAQVALRRLAILETLYRLAPALAADGHLARPEWETPPRLSDFRLMRRGGFFTAVARYGADCWTPFTYAGLHATERVLRRKQQHRFWNLDCYAAEQDRVFRISNRVFYEDPEQEVRPSALVVVAADPWAADLAGRTLDPETPTLVCTPDRRCSGPVEPRASRDLVSDSQSKITVGRPQRLGRWLRRHPDLEALSGQLAYRLFLLVAEFPAMRPGWLRELAGGSTSAVRAALGRLLDTGLVVQFEGGFFLAERGMKRAANLSRVRAAVVRNRHGAYLEGRYRRREQQHNDGINRLVLAFAREGARVFAGWRGELNIPGLTQVRPDLLLLVAEGPFGAGPYAVEYERSTATRTDLARKLGPYRRAAAAGQGLPVLFVCERADAAQRFIAARGPLALLATGLESALAGPLTGARTIWSEPGRVVRLRCRS
ncbi:MAG: hypothetical protein F4X58_07605 [Chloroflexi bacterium]|nr:hypothetical protein [Chloroflexota bacterium]MYC01773.1 hypothetical protein [Chloroflexota bacterium]